LRKSADTIVPEGGFGSSKSTLANSFNTDADETVPEGGGGELNLPGAVEALKDPLKGIPGMEGANGYGGFSNGFNAAGRRLLSQRLHEANEAMSTLTAAQLLRQQMGRSLLGGVIPGDPGILKDLPSADSMIHHTGGVQHLFNLIPPDVVSMIPPTFGADLEELRGKEENVTTCYKKTSSSNTTEVACFNKTVASMGLDQVCSEATSVLGQIVPIVTQVHSAVSEMYKLMASIQNILILLTYCGMWCLMLAFGEGLCCFFQRRVDKIHATRMKLAVCVILLLFPCGFYFALSHTYESTCTAFGHLVYTVNGDMDKSELHAIYNEEYGNVIHGVTPYLQMCSSGNAQGAMDIIATAAGVNGTAQLLELLVAELDQSLPPELKDAVFNATSGPILEAVSMLKQASTHDVPKTGLGELDSILKVTMGAMKDNVQNISKSLCDPSGPWSAGKCTKSGYAQRLGLSSENAEGSMLVLNVMSMALGEAPELLNLVAGGCKEAVVALNTMYVDVCAGDDRKHLTDARLYLVIIMFTIVFLQFSMHIAEHMIPLQKRPYPSHFHKDNRFFMFPSSWKAHGATGCREQRFSTYSAGLQLAKKRLLAQCQDETLLPEDRESLSEIIECLDDAIWNLRSATTKTDPCCNNTAPESLDKALAHVKTCLETLAILDGRKPEDLELGDKPDACCNKCGNSCCSCCNRYMAANCNCCSECSGCSCCQESCRNCCPVGYNCSDCCTPPKMRETDKVREMLCYKNNELSKYLDDEIKLDELPELLEGMFEIDKLERTAIPHEYVYIEPADLPAEFKCAYTGQCMSDPVVADNNQSYERDLFLKHQPGDRHPSTNAEFPNHIVATNHELQKGVQQYKKQLRTEARKNCKNKGWGRSLADGCPDGCKYLLELNGTHSIACPHYDTCQYIYKPHVKPEDAEGDQDLLSPEHVLRVLHKSMVAKQVGKDKSTLSWHNDIITAQHHAVSYLPALLWSLPFQSLQTLFLYMNTKSELSNLKNGAAFDDDDEILWVIPLIIACGFLDIMAAPLLLYPTSRLGPRLHDSFCKKILYVLGLTSVVGAAACHIAAISICSTAIINSFGNILDDWADLASFVAALVHSVFNCTVELIIVAMASYIYAQKDGAELVGRSKIDVISMLRGEYGHYVISLDNSTERTLFDRITSGTTSNSAIQHSATVRHPDSSDSDTDHD